MIRSSTPFFVLTDRLRGEVPRPGVDDCLAAGIPQQNGTEAAVWAVLVAGLTAAGVFRALELAGLESRAIMAMAVPLLTFAAFHLMIVVVGAFAGLAGIESRGQMRIWIAGYSALAIWVTFAPSWIRFAGWIWLIWMFLSVLAWIINAVWKTATADSQ